MSGREEGTLNFAIGADGPRQRLIFMHSRILRLSLHHFDAMQNNDRRRMLVLGEQEFALRR